MSHYPVNPLQFDQSLINQAMLDQTVRDPFWPGEDSASQQAESDTTQARYILNRLFQDYSGTFAVRLWNGRTLQIGEGTPAFTVCLQQASVLRNMVWFTDPKHLAEAYLAGQVQILGDFHAAMQLREHFEALSLPLHEKLSLVFRAFTLAPNAELSHVPQDSTSNTGNP